MFVFVRMSSDNKSHLFEKLDKMVQQKIIGPKITLVSVIASRYYIGTETMRIKLISTLPVN